VRLDYEARIDACIEFGVLKVGKVGHGRRGCGLAGCIFIGIFVSIRTPIPIDSSSSLRRSL
jgi:hypothetical protein